MAGRRRGHGEGTVCQRGSDGLWVASVVTGATMVQDKRDPTGPMKPRLLRSYRYAKTQAEAIRALGELRRLAAAGVHATPQTLTVAQFFTDWLEKTRPSWEVSTYRRTEQIVRLHIIPGLGAKRLAKLTPADVQHFLNSMAAPPEPAKRSNAAKRPVRKVSPRTAQYVRGILVQALTKATSWGYVQRNVAALTDGPKVPKPEFTPFTVAQAQAFIRGTTEHLLGPLFYFALAVGMRQGEILGLQWADIDFDRAEVRVRQSLTRMAGEYRLKPLKTKGSRRTVAIQTPVVAILRDPQARQSPVEGPWKDLVFRQPDGQPLAPEVVRRQFVAELVRLGLPQIRFHDMRHSFATFSLSANVAMKVVQEQLGHSTIAVTSDIYSHVMSELQHEAAARVEQLLAGG